jgi:phosphoglycerate dehydrogenase-like enzyme
MTTAPTILILDRDAADYERRLAPLRAAGIAVLAADDGFPDGASGATVVLGEPDRVVIALPRLPELRWVQSTWAGLTPLVDAARQGLTVTGIKDVFGAQMAEFVMAYLLDHAIGVDARRRAQQEGKWLATPTETLQDKVLGVMGTGSIGSEVARRAAAFGMRLNGYSRDGAAREPFDRVFTADRLHEFLAGCDYVAGVLPDTPETRELLDGEALAAMPQHAVLVNVGRGTLVDDQALVEALENGRLAGAVLDVFREEPLPSNHPFWHCPGLTVTAHVAARSWPADIAEIFEENLRRFRAGEPLQYQLDPQRGY